MKDSQNIFSELYHDGRGDKPPIKKNFDGPPIMKDEVRKAVKSMKKGKAAGPDKITVEMIESLDEFGIDMCNLLHLPLVCSLFYPVGVIRLNIATTSAPGDCHLCCICLEVIAQFCAVTM